MYRPPRSTFVSKTPRIEPRRISHNKMDNHTAQTCYRAGYGNIIVNSKFKGDKPLSELLFNMLFEKHIKNYSGMP